MKNSFKVILFILFFYFISRTGVFSKVYFEDDFDTWDDNKWFYYCNYTYGVMTKCESGASKVLYSDSSINLSTEDFNPKFPVILSKIDNIIPTDSNFQIGVKFRYPSTTPRGVGLGIGFTGTYNKLFSQFGIWKDTTSSGFKFYYNDFNGNCSNFKTGTSDLAGRITKENVSLTNNVWHYLDIFKIGDYYYVYIDKIYGNDIPIFVTSIRGSCIPKIVWFGNFESDGGGAWTTISLDKIIVTDDNLPILTPSIGVSPTITPTVDLTPTVTPTLIPTLTLTPTTIPTEVPTLTPTITPTATPLPTQTPVPTPEPRRKKIFVLPGLGASWNSEAIVYGNSVNDDSWEMTPFVNNYNGLIKMLENNGLVKNQDYFVWNYDWRRPMEEIKNKFNSFVNSKNLNSNDDIYLVGHSLGGVVARLWAQENKTNENIKQVIALGSPNLGSLDVYSVWSGGEVLEYDGVSSVAFQILLSLQNRGLIVTDIDKIRNFAPIVKDLLPTFNYAFKNNEMISWNNLSISNNYLDSKNAEISSISNKLFLSTGVGKSTPSVLKLGGRSIYDELLNLWPDGELLGIVKDDGDGTVLKNSAAFDSSNKLELTTDHGAIVNDSVSWIGEKLGLGNTLVDFVYSDNFADSLVVFVGSPATAELKCGNDVYNEIDGFIVAKNQSYSECNLVLSPTGSGLVHLVLGNTQSNKWDYVEKNVGVGVSDVVVVNFNNMEIINDTPKNSQEFLKNQIRTDLNNLGLVNSVVDFENGFFTKVAVRIFEYRKLNDERVVSQRLLDDLFDLANLIGWDKKVNNFSGLSNYVTLVENRVRDKNESNQISHNSVASLAMLGGLKDNLGEMSQHGSVTSYSMAVVLASGYGTEALRD